MGLMHSLRERCRPKAVTPGLMRRLEEARALLDALPDKTAPARMDAKRVYVTLQDVEDECYGLMWWNSPSEYEMQPMRDAGKYNAVADPKIQDRTVQDVHDHLLGLMETVRRWSARGL